MVTLWSSYYCQLSSPGKVVVFKSWSSCRQVVVVKLRSSGGQVVVKVPSSLGQVMVHSLKVNSRGITSESLRAKSNLCNLARALAQS